MIKLERTSVTNFDNAMRGARNPMNSWGVTTPTMTKTATLSLVPTI